MKYGKLINGELILAPRKLVGEETTTYNPTPEMLESAGYKPVVYTNPPVVEEGYVAVAGWVEENDEIVETWQVVEAPDEIEADEAMNILFGE